jgi:hypothetical protein
MVVAVFRYEGASRPVALWASTVVSAALLAGVIYFWTHRSAAPAIATANPAVDKQT